MSEARIGNSIDLPPMPLPPELPADERPATLDDLLPVVERIAEALEAQVRPTACAEVHISGRKCVLDERHVGHHTTGDGRVHWLDDE